MKCFSSGFFCVAGKQELFFEIFCSTVCRACESYGNYGWNRRRKYFLVRWWTTFWYRYFVLQFYETFIDPFLMSKIVEETTKYAKRCIQSSVARQFSKSKFWEKTIVEKLHAFFTLNILQGIAKKPGINHYWSKRYLTNTPFFSKIMSHRRFCLLQRYLHFSDNAAFDPQNHEWPKLVKIWPVLKHLNKKFSEMVTLEQNVTINESLMFFKGLQWKQSILLKRARFEVKCFILCDSISGQ